jgi:hypothetical protein
MFVVPARQATYAGGIDSFASMLALLKSLKILALENYTVCYVTLSLTPSGLNLCQVVKTVHNTLETLFLFQTLTAV